MFTSQYYFNARLAQVNLITRIVFDAKLSSLNRKITRNKSNTVKILSCLPHLQYYFNARLAQVNLITKIVFDAKLSSLNRKITRNKSKHLLVENEFKKLKTFGSSYFIGKSHFEEDSA